MRRQPFKTAFCQKPLDSGREHVKANIERKLDELKFPSAQKQQIVSDILGGPKPTSDGCLYDCEDEN